MRMDDGELLFGAESCDKLGGFPILIRSDAAIEWNGHPRKTVFLNTRTERSWHAGGVDFVAALAQVDQLFAQERIKHVIRGNEVQNADHPSLSVPVSCAGGSSFSRSSHSNMSG